jgi:PAS domain S-box-containing protein
MRLRTKLLIIYIGLSTALFTCGGLIALHLVSQAVKSDVENNFRNGTRAVINLVETTAQGAIKNYLRAVAERNLEIADAIYRQYLAGQFTESESRKRIRETILSQRIGESGYIYCVDSRGVATVHPNIEVEGNNWGHFEFVRKQTKKKTGYLEYQWRNPDELSERPKALYMAYFEPFDWIISVTTYRDDFKRLLPMDEIRHNVKELKFGESGYAFIADSRGDVLIHPELEGRNLFELKDQEGQFFDKVIQEGFGQIVYWLQDSDESKPREELALYGYIPEYQWIVGATGYLDEIYAPIVSARRSALLFIGVAVLLSTLITMFISNHITRRLKHLMAVITKGDQGDLTARAKPGSTDEIGKLARIYNSFLEKLQSYHEKLDAEIELHRTTAESLKKSESLFEVVFNQAFQFIGILTPDGRNRKINQTALDFTGVKEEALIGKKFWDGPFWAHSKQLQENVKKAVGRAANKQFSRMEVEQVSLSGERHSFDFSLKPLMDDSGQVILLIVEGRDITARRKLEDQIQQSQRMESIGNLAGGIAHDFNNLLFPIVGMSELLLQDLPKNSPERENVQVIFNAAQRGSQLVNQILAFSRQAEHKKLPVRIQHVLKEVLRLSRATIPSDIEIERQKLDDCGLVMADPTQIHQIAMNLITNAYHAVEQTGGKITVALENTERKPTDWGGLSLPAGTYAKMTISDTGHGIDPTIQEKIFDPYFTTKEQGKGTGLGLAVVYGIVKAHGGDIKVFSEAGKGTTFSVFLPLMETTSETVQVEIVENKAFGNERVLLVDDETSIVELEKQILERFGYRVTSRVNSLEALKAFKAKSSSFDLVVTDMNMPYLTGAQLAEELLTVKPDIPIILCTGFSERIDEEKAEALGIKGYLMKPIVVSEFARKVRNVLDDNKKRGPTHDQ